jgi:NAD(P)-dependent dehydrogenase (short-subunit alcohol dehydrogenase family)
MTRSLVIGASGDLGGAVAEELRGRGDEVLVHGHANSERLDEIARLVGASEKLSCDVRNEEEVAGLFQHIEQLDNLVYCAAVNPTVARVAELELGDWNDVMAVNLTGAFLAAKHALPILRCSTDPAVVVVSSVFGLETPSRRSAYGASKHGLNGLVQALTREEGSWLRVNAVCPGPMWSDNLRRILERHADAEAMSVEDYVMQRLSDVPARRLMELEECASVISFLCSPAAAFVRGESIRITGGAVQ